MTEQKRAGCQRCRRRWPISRNTEGPNPHNPRWVALTVGDSVCALCIACWERSHPLARCFYFYIGWRCYWKGHEMREFANPYWILSCVLRDCAAEWKKPWMIQK